MKDALVTLAAGPSQVPLIRRAQEMGFAVLAVDKDPKAVGFALADVRIVRSTHDANGILAALLPRRSEYRIRGILTKSSGQPVLSAAHLARTLELPGLDPELVEAASSKPGLLELARSAGLATPVGVATYRAADTRNEEIAYPRVVRPARTRVGKLDVRLVTDAPDFAAAHAAAAASSEDGRVLVEEFVEGRDVLVCGLLASDAANVLALVDEDTRFDAGRQAKGYGFRVPSCFEGTPWKGRLLEATERFFARHRFGTGVFFLTFRVDANGPAELSTRLLEAHFDLPGDQLVEGLFPAAGGPDFLSEAIALATARPHKGSGAGPFQGSLWNTVLRFLYASDLAREGDAKRAQLSALDGCLRVDVDLPPTRTKDPRIGLALFRTTEDPTALEAECDRILGRASS